MSVTEELMGPIDFNSIHQHDFHQLLVYQHSFTRSSVFRRKKFIQVWNNLMASKSQNLHFWVKN